MSELKFRNIKNVEDDKVVGLAQGDSGPYNSVLWREVDGTSLNQFIIDFNTFLLDDLKLTKVDDPLQIDPTNIVYKTTLNTLKSEATTYKQAGSASLNEYEMGYNTFSFNDELQETFPIILKFRYVFRNIENFTSNPGFPRLTFIIKLSVIDGNTNIPYINDQYLASYITTVHTNSTAFYKIIQDQVESFGFYTNGRLFLNIMPQRNVLCAAGSNSYTIPKNAYCSFYLERNENIVKYFNLGYISYNSFASAQAPNIQYNTNPASIMYWSTTGGSSISSDQFCYIPYIENGIKAGNSQFSTFKTIDISPTTGYFYDSDKILVCYKDQINQSINSQTIDVKLANGETAKYLVYNNTKNIRYFLNTNTSLLLRYDK